MRGASPVSFAVARRNVEEGYQWSSQRIFDTAPSTSGSASKAAEPASASPTSRRTRWATSSTSIFRTSEPSSRRTSRSARSSRPSRCPTSTAPCRGTIVERNPLIDDHPELVNEQPYGDGWLVLIETPDPDRVAAMMDAAAYRALVEAQD